MTEPVTPFDLLLRYVDKVRRALDTIEDAKRLPDQLASSVRRVNIHADSYSRDEAVKAAAEEIRQKTVETMRRRGEAERDQKIAAAIAEIESVRVILPDFAARACIDLGRRCRAEVQS